MSAHDGSFPPGPPARCDRREACAILTPGVYHTRRGSCRRVPAPRRKGSGAGLREGCRRRRKKEGRGWWLVAVVRMMQLLESGVPFGHQTRRWNPKMKPYIFTERNG